MRFDPLFWFPFNHDGCIFTIAVPYLLMILGNSNVKSETNLSLPVEFHGYFLHNGILRMNADYNGDGRPDKVQWRRKSNTGMFEWQLWSTSMIRWDPMPLGHDGDIPVMGDFNGDRVYDFAVWTPRTGAWSYQLDRKTRFELFGQKGDVPMNGDYTGDGISDYVLWRPAEATFYVKDARRHTITTQKWGTSEDIPISGDFNFDYITDYVVWDTRKGNWNIKLNHGAGEIDRVKFGQVGDIPVSGDFTHDGFDDYVVYTPSDNKWRIKNGKTGEVTSVRAIGRQTGRSVLDDLYVRKAITTTTLEPLYMS